MLAILCEEGDNVLVYDTDDVQGHRLHRESAEVSPGEVVFGVSSFTIVFKAGKHPVWMSKNIKDIKQVDERPFAQFHM